MKGGLLQLATIGKEDSVLTNKPEIFHFKKVYLKYTNFSIDNNFRNYGNKKFDTNFNFKIDVNGDLLKDLYFYLEIPYFDLLKKVTKKEVQFNRTVSDKIYYNTLNFKTLVFFDNDKKIYLIPENLLFYPKNNFMEENISSLDIISLTNIDYQKYFSKDNIFKNLKFKEAYKNNVQKYLKTIDSFWFNCFFDKILEKDEISNSNIVLMDYKKFNLWLTNIINDELLFSYNNNYSIYKNRKLMDIYFLGDNLRKVNEIRKYNEIINRLNTVDENNYINEDLDFDKSILYLLSQKSDLESNRTFLLNSIQYNSSFLYYIYSRNFGDLYTGNNWFSFYLSYKVNKDINNDILDKNENVYEIKNWDNYINDLFGESFDNQQQKEFSSYIFNNFLNESNQVEGDIFNIWSGLNPVNPKTKDSTIPYIFSIVYSFAKRFCNYNNYGTINFLDFFTSDDENSFEKELDYNFDNYSSIDIINLPNIYTTYKNKLDITFIYCYYIYKIAYVFYEDLIFENFNKIDKQNIQFFYWLRNKIANQIFLRFQRIQNFNLRPEFGSISNNTDELINLYYSYLPNNYVSKKLIDNELYQTFFNSTYYGNLTTDTNNDFKKLEKISSITQNTYDDTTSGKLESSFLFEINVGDYIQNLESKHIIKITKDLDFFISDLNTNTITLNYKDKVYNVSDIYIENGYLILNIFSVVNIIETFDDKFTLDVIINMKINKYYFDTNSISYNNTSNITFDTSNNRVFYSNKYIDTDLFSFTMNSDQPKFNTNLIVDSSSVAGATITYKTSINEEFLFQDLFSSDTYKNYSVNVKKNNNFNNTTLKNFDVSELTINGEKINKLNIRSDTENYFTYTSTSSYFLNYNSKVYPINLATDSSNTFILSGIETSLLSGVASDQYTLTEHKQIFSPSSLTLTGTVINVNQFNNFNESQKTFQYSGGDLSGENNRILVLKDSKYYHADLSSSYGGTSGNYQFLNYSLDLSGTTILSNYEITFTSSIVFDSSDSHFFEVKSNGGSTTEDVKVYEYVYDSSGALSKYYNSLISNVINYPYTLNATKSTGVELNTTSSLNGSGAIINLISSGQVTKSSNALSSSITTNVSSIGNNTYNNIDTITDNSGIGCKLSITGNGTSIIDITVDNSGIGYCIEDTLTVSSSDINSDVDLVITLKQSDVVNPTISNLTVSNSGTNYSNGEILTISTSDISGSAENLQIQLTNSEFQNIKTNFNNENNNFRYKLFSKNNTNYSQITTGATPMTLDVKSDFQSYEDIYSTNDNVLGTMNITSKLINKFKSENLISVKKFDTDKYDYYLLLISNSSNQKRKIVFNKTSNQNEIYFEFLGINNQNYNYYIHESINLFSLKNVKIQKIKKLYKTENITSRIYFDEINDIYTLTLPLGSSFEYNDEIYYKYVKNESNTFYLLDSNSRISLDNPTVDSSNINFKILGKGSFSQNESDLVRKLVVYNNKILPNLIKFTSFYLQDLADKTYDLMDFFVQSPMLIYLDYNSNKNSSVIFYNLPFNIDNATLKYNKLDGKLIHFVDKINSNQVVRYNNNLISSSFDNNIFNQNKNTKFEILNKLQSHMNSIYNSDNINEIMNSVESTNNLIDLLYKDFTNNIFITTYGKTIKQIYNNFIIENTKEIGINPRTKKNSDYNLFTKSTIDFYGTYDSNLTLTSSLGNGRDIFVTNYRPLLQTQKLSSNMLNYIYNFESAFESHKIYFDDNGYFKTISSFPVFNKFDNIYKFQQDIRNQIYLDDDKIYKFEYLNKDDTSIYSDLSSFEYYKNEDKITKIEFDTSNNILTKLEIEPVAKSVYKYSDYKNGSSYQDSLQYFNFLGPLLIDNSNISKGSIYNKFDSNTDYIFTDDVSNCYLIDTIKDVSLNYFKIENYEHKLLKSSYVSSVSEKLTVNMTSQEIYLYEFENDNKFNINDFLILDNTLARVYSVTYGSKNNILVISALDLDLKNPQVFKGTFRTENLYNNINFKSYEVLKYNLFNLIEFSSQKYYIGELKSKRKFTKYFSLSDLDVLNNTFCTLEDGIMQFQEIDSNIYTNITGTNIYKLGSKIIDSKPLVLKDGIVKYFNLDKKINEDSYIYYNNNIGKLKNITISNPENCWYFKGNLDNYLVDISTKINIETKEINLSELDNYKFSFVKVNDIFYYLNDFTHTTNPTNSSDVSNVYLLLDSVFSGNKEIYSYQEKNNSSINLNVPYQYITPENSSYNLYDISSNLIFLTNNFRQTRFQAVNLLFSNLVRPLSVLSADSNNPYYKLSYKLYEDITYAIETDSVWKISENLISPTGLLKDDTSIYLNFDISSINPLVNDYFTTYYFDPTKVSYVCIDSNNSNVKTEILDSSSSKWRFTIPAETKFEKGHFYNYYFNVEFEYESIQYNSDLILNVLVDDSYSQSLRMNINNDYVYLNEPFIISNFSSTSDLIKDSSNLDFSGCIPNIFTSDDNIVLKPNITNNFNNIKSYTTTLNYMSLPPDNTLKKQEINTNNNYFNYWELIGQVVVNRNIFYILSDYYEIIKDSSNCILNVDNVPYYFNIIKDVGVEDNYNVFKLDRSEFEIDKIGYLFININPVIKVNRNLIVNSSISKIKTDFGTLRNGEIIILDEKKLLIEEYSQESKSYCYKLIDGGNNNDLRINYEKYYSYGQVNNLNNCFDLPDFSNVNYLISKKNDEFKFGDFIYNSSYIGFYDNSDIDLKKDSINYTFSNDTGTIYIRKENSDWFYVGNYLNPNSKLECNYTDPNDGLIKKTELTIKYVFNNKVYWKESYTDILDNLNDYFGNDYIFKIHYNPFKFEYQKVSSSNIIENVKEGFIDISGIYYKINDNKLIGYEYSLNNGYYYTAKLDKFISKFSDTSYNVYPFRKVVFEDISFYRSDKIYIDSATTNDTEIADISFNKKSEYYVYDNNNYIYPVYLDSSENITEYYTNIIDNMNIYYNSNTVKKTTTVPDVSYGYLNLRGVFYYCSNNTYSYPLYLDVNQLNIQNIDNSMNSITVSGSIESLINKPIFDSSAITSAYYNVEYKYSLPNTLTDVSSTNLPSWLSLDFDNTNNNYDLKGTPTINDISSNSDIELIATSNNIKGSQKFSIHVAGDENALRFKYPVVTKALIGEKYNLDVSATKNIVGIKYITKPSWLDFSNNILVGTPSYINVGENLVVLEASDSSNNTVRQKFTINVDYNNHPYFSSNPTTDIQTNSAYLYTIGVFPNVSVTGVTLPGWLNVVYNGDTNTYDLSGTSPNTESNDSVELKIIDSSLRIATQKFNINTFSSESIRFVTNPKTSIVNYSDYFYNIRANDYKGNILDISKVTIPEWLDIDNSNNLYGKPTNKYYGENQVIVRAVDSSGNYKDQTFTINVVDRKLSTLKINDGVFENSLKYLGYSYYSKLFINGRFFDFENIIKYPNYSEILLRNNLDLSGEVDITFPITENNKIETSINNYLINLNSVLNQKLIKKNSYNIYCYYYKTSVPDQLQVITFTVNYYSDDSFLSPNFTPFYLDALKQVHDLKIFVENYLPIEIYSRKGNIFSFVESNSKISLNNRFLLEEVRKDSNTKIMHSMDLKYEKGFVKLNNEFDYLDDSDFFLDKIYPLRIKGDFTQINFTYVTKKQCFGVNDPDYLIKFIQVPIKIVSRPLYSSTLGWYVEISSKYINLLNRYDIYLDLPNTDNFKKVKLEFTANKFYLYFTELPKLNLSFVYVKTDLYFKSLEKKNNTLDTNNNSFTPNFNRGLLDVFKKTSFNNNYIGIPIKISDQYKNGDNLIAFNYSLVDYDFINLNNTNLISLEIPKLEITNYGFNDDSRVEVTVSEILDLSNNNKIHSSNLFYKYEISDSIYSYNIEPEMSINNYVNMNLDTQVNTQLSYYKYKTCKDWTSITFDDNLDYSNNKQTYRQYLKVNDSSDVTILNDNSGSVLLFEEIKNDSKLQNICKLLVDISNNTLSRLEKVRDIEKIIFNYVSQNSKYVYFWKNPINNINSYLSSYRDSLGNQLGYSVVKNCIVGNDENTSDTDIFEIIDDANIIRRAYLDSQFTIAKFNGYIEIRRLKKQIKYDIDLFVNKRFDSNFGVNSHLLLQDLYLLQKGKLNFTDYLKNGEDFNFEYEILTSEKLLISKQWEQIKNNKEFNNFNKEFNDKLEIKYQTNKKNLSGVAKNKIGYEFGIGLESLSDIQNYNSNLDSNVYYNLYCPKEFDKSKYIDYEIDSKELLKYKVISNNSKIEPNYRYKLDFLEGSNVLIDEEIYPYEYSSNSFIFNSNKDFKDYDDLSLKIIKDYNISTSKFLGYYYKDIKILDLSSGKVNFYLDENQIINDYFKVKTSLDGLLKTKDDALLNSVTSSITSIGVLYRKEILNLSTTTTGSGTGCVLKTNANSSGITSITVTTQGSGYVIGDTIKVSSSDIGSDTDLVITLNGSEFETYTSFNLISKDLLKNTDYFKIELTVPILTQTISVNKNYLTFTSNFEKANLNNVSENLYLITTNKTYKLFSDSDGYYIFETEKITSTSETKINVYYNISDITSFNSNLFVYEILLSEELDNYYYRTDDSLNLNFKINEESINDYKVLSDKKVYIYNDSNLTPLILNQEFRLENFEPILVNSLDFENSKFLLEIKNSIKLLTDHTIKLKKDSSPEISTTFYKYPDSFNLMVSLDDKYSKVDLRGYQTEITNILPVSSYVKNQNFLSFDVSQSLDLIFDDKFSYYVDISGSYGIVDNSNIVLSKNNVQIKLPNWESYTAQTSFNFKQVNLDLKGLNFILKDQISKVNISKKKRDLDKKEIKLSYLDKNTNNDIGNYIYYFYKGNSNFDISKKYKLKVNNLENDVYLIGDHSDNVYISTVDKIKVNSSSSYKFYEENYDYVRNLNYTDISYQSKAYVPATIIKSIDLSNFQIRMRTEDLSNTLISFPDSSNINANLYFTSSIKNQNDFTIENIANKDLSFPDELLYKNYITEIVTVENKKEKVIWDKYFAFKLFEYIDFYIDDQKIDSMDKNIYKVNQLYQNQKDKQLQLVPKIVDNKFILHLPTFFWFSQDSANFLPLVSLSNSTVNVKTMISNLSSLITNNLDGLENDMNSYRINIGISTDSILLDSFEREKFATFNHEYLIQRNVALPKLDILKTRKEVTLSLKGLIKDVFWVFESNKTGNNYYIESRVDIDETYAQYVKFKNQYDIYLANNRTFGENEDENNREIFYIFDKINKEIENDSGTGIVNTFKKDLYFKNFDLTFLLYLYYSKLRYIDNWDVAGYINGIEGEVTFTAADLVRKKKLEKIVLYLKNLYKDNITERKFSPVNNLQFKANGRLLLVENNSSYFNNVVPYEKFTFSPELGILAYSFSLYPTLQQPSGHLNFNILANSTAIIDLNERVLQESVSFQPIIKEYNILRIISGNSSLSWN